MKSNRRFNCLMKLLLVLVSGISASNVMADEPAKPVQLIVLGIAQDAGFPQAACQKNCCAAAWKDHSLRKNVMAF